MGYAAMDQKTNGIHLRLYSRAFIFSDGVKRNVYVCGDIMGGTQIVKLKVNCKIIAAVFLCLRWGMHLWIRKQMVFICVCFPEHLCSVMGIKEMYLYVQTFKQGLKSSR